MAQSHLIADKLKLPLELLSSEALGQRGGLRLVHGRVIVQLNGSFQAIATDPGALEKCGNPSGFPPELGVGRIAVQGNAEIVQCLPSIVLHIGVSEKSLFLHRSLASLVFDAVDNELAVVFVRQVKGLR